MSVSVRESLQAPRALWVSSTSSPSHHFRSCKTSLDGAEQKMTFGEVHFIQALWHCQEPAAKYSPKLHLQKGKKNLKAGAPGQGVCSAKGEGWNISRFSHYSLLEAVPGGLGEAEPAQGTAQNWAQVKQPPLCTQSSFKANPGYFWQCKPHSSSAWSQGEQLNSLNSPRGCLLLSFKSPISL